MLHRDVLVPVPVTGSQNLSSSIWHGCCPVSAPVEDAGPSMAGFLSWMSEGLRLMQNQPHDGIINDCICIRAQSRGADSIAPLTDTGLHLVGIPDTV
jgi:hypothetical protein